MKNLIVFALMMTVSAMSFAQNERTLKLNKDTNTIDVIYYHDNGLISQTGAYTINGKLQGEWLSYDAKGEKTALAQYDQGEKVGTWYFYQKEVLQEVNYTDNRIVKVITWKDKESQVVGNF